MAKGREWGRLYLKDLPSREIAETAKQLWLTLQCCHMPIHSA